MKLLFASKRIALAACLIGAAVVIRVLVVLPARLDPQGRSSSACIASSLAPAGNVAGMEATGHLTVCDSMFVHDSATYIYLHRQHERENPQSLVFRFFDDPYAAAPVVKWISPSQLSISVESVDLVTKMVSSYEGIEIVYSIGREKEQREMWDRQVLQLHRTIIDTSAAAVVLLLLTVWLWSSIRREKRSASSDADSKR
jgi:hypothetical protein